jgi:hypothetical protein
LAKLGKMSGNTQSCPFPNTFAMGTMPVPGNWDAGSATSTLTTTPKASFPKLISEWTENTTNPFLAGLSSSWPSD